MKHAAVILVAGLAGSIVLDASGAETVSLNLKNVSVKKALDAVRENSSINVAYQPTMLDAMGRTVTVRCRNVQPLRRSVRGRPDRRC